MLKHKTGRFVCPKISSFTRLFPCRLTMLLTLFCLASFLIITPLADAAYMYASDTVDGYLKKIDEATGVTTDVSLIGDPASVEVKGLNASPSYEHSDATYMYASDTVDGYLKKIDEATGVATDVGLIGDPASVEMKGLAASPYEHFLYGSETKSYDLWKIDVRTGAGTTVGAFGYDIKELAYDTAGDVLYGTDYSSLYTVDQSTGAASFIGDFGLNYELVYALDYDIATSRIYGVDFGEEALFWSDTATGAATSIGYTDRDIGSRISDIAFDRQTGVLYGIESFSTSDSFFILDKYTGVSSDVGSMGEPIHVVGLAQPVPEPASFILLGCGLLGLVNLVRKRRA